MNKVKEMILAGQPVNYYLIIPKSFFTKNVEDKNENLISSIIEIKGETVTICNINNMTYKFTTSFSELEKYIRNETFTLTLRIRL